MSEKRIKGIVDTNGSTGIKYIESDEPLPPHGTEVEIVYREEVEIRPGQKWLSYGCILTVIEFQANKHGHSDYGCRHGHHVLKMECGMQSDPCRCTKSQLQSWLNEHATPVE